MNATSEGHRQQLLDGLRRFVVSVRQIAGVRRIAVLGSIVTTKRDPKDIDVLVVVADDAEPFACTASEASDVIGTSPRRSDRCAIV